MGESHFDHIGDHIGDRVDVLGHRARVALFVVGLVAVVAAAAWAWKARAEIPKQDRLAQPAPLDQRGTPDELLAMVLPGGKMPSPDVVALGQKLFFDGRLSEDGTVACATCHEPDKGFTDQLPTSKGIRNQIGQRNAPTILNALFNQTQFWDGRSPTLEEQAKLPILNPVEMGRKSPDEVVAAVRAIPEYQQSFQTLYGRAPTYDDIAGAIAAYERTQLAFDSPFDRYLTGDDKAISAAAKRGWSLFNGRGRCMTCHAVNSTKPLFTDDKFHNIGVAAHKSDFVDLARKALAAVQKGDTRRIDELAIQTHFSELGRFLFTKNTADVGAFKTTGLRNLLVTEPYFHDGSAQTLWDVLDHYNKGGELNPFLDGAIHRLDLSEQELDDLVAFMASLTSSRYQAAADKELARQRALKVKRRPNRDLAAVRGQAATSGTLKGALGDPVPEPGKKDPAAIGAL